MSMKDYLGFQKTPQSRPIPGREKEMVRNDAGGYVFPVDEETKLRRFLILGTDGGTYYCSEREHTIRNFLWILEFLRKDARTVLQITAELSEQGRILKNDTAIAVLALAWVNGYRGEVEEVFPRIVRIPTHLFKFLEYAKQAFGGKIHTSRRLRNMIRDWYYGNPNLVYHVLKYQSREGWSHRDVLRIGHVKPKDEFMDELFGFIVGKEGKVPDHPLVEAFIALRKASSLEEVLDVIRNSDVTWEFVPAHWLGRKEVWEALLPKLPLTALLRNLGRLSALGVVQPFGETERYVADRLTDETAIRKARIHPVQVGIAMKTYEQGRGIRGSLSWTVSKRVLEALEEMFMKSFANVEPTRKRFLIAIDGSGSMCWENISGIPMQPVEAATLVALPIVRTEPDSLMMGFDHEYWEVPVTSSTRWRELMMYFGKGGATDASLPFKYAMDRGIEVDVFVIFTDNETWWGDEHPVQALERYREAMGIESKLIVGAMTATDYSIVDPQDPYQLDVVGFDPQYPQILGEFANL